MPNPTDDLPLPSGHIELLSGSHSISSFTCHNANLDDYLKRHALRDQESGARKTYVYVTEQREIAGYVTLGSYSLPRRALEGLCQLPSDPRDQLSLVLLDVLAVDGRYQKRGLGKYLLDYVDILVASIEFFIGTSGLALCACDKATADFYRKHGFEEVNDPTSWYYDGGIVMFKPFNKALRVLFD